MLAATAALPYRLFSGARYGRLRIVARTRGAVISGPGRKSLPIACGVHGIPTVCVILLTDGA